ncbi:MAG: DnaA regulatory inactivator Hda [Hydrogenophilales bacterium CG17_big_fil_post_rev_8_21_14_2_50_63_12]|nr:MAG: DnaA regulatory inactivator Hda [Hydrogenophilales bacterium CG17_big_fil_post_rev_8_21_14_2_50_63_12]PIX98241.1 MAG: DnaA regulatory inactivator Hda [Hydrogenophilales bacterium CG_4_10_14_3_um_filter_63_21]PJB03464.1 MAG: DnaA regulatory inactivator Hda [Hydrogenophilales bacterium CG_4_9_14_3_um_filter_63_34]
MRQLILDLRPDSPPDFSNYLPGPNAEALAALRGHIPGGTREPLLTLWGEAGVGKSHLLRAWARALGAVLPTARESLPEPPVPALAVDDVDSLDADNQIRLFSLINSAREQGGLLLASGTLPPARLGLRPDLATRLAQGLVFRLLPLSDADKATALVIRAEGRGLRLPEEVIRYLLAHSRRGLPRLLATVDALDTFSLSRKRPVSVPLLKEMLRLPW